MRGRVAIALMCGWLAIAPHAHVYAYVEPQHTVMGDSVYIQLRPQHIVEKVPKQSS